MTDEQPRTSGRSLLKQLEVLPNPYQYILSLRTQITKLFQYRLLLKKSHKVRQVM